MTRFPLDTNVLSELVRPVPDAAVAGFVGRLDPDGMFVSVMSRFEIRRGLERLPAGRRKDAFERRYERLLRGMRGGLLTVTAREADVGARIVSAARAAGFPLDDHLFDVLIAATASVHELTVVTRNERQFRATGVPVRNPWRQ